VYSGLISEVGIVQSGVRTEQGMLLTVHAPATAARLRPGGSVAVAGVCLTAVAVEGDTFSVLAGAETESRSTLRPPLDGRRVNLELPLRAGDPLDGHLVQGHVDGTARVAGMRRVGGVQYVWLRPNKRLIADIVPKGSVTVDGVSLTVVEVNKGAFSVALIPETLRRTTLATLAEGDSVNVETDVMPKYQRRFGHAPRPALAWSGLSHGPEAVEKAIATIAAGGKVIVWDPSREGEGDVIMAGDRVSPADINFFMTHVRGLLCAPTDAALLARLGIERIPGDGDHHGTAFMVPVDAAEGTTTGIPASERARTIRLLASPDAGPASFVRPGHVFPLAAHPGGLAARQGHTEAAVALATWAGRPPVALCCEIAAVDGEMARLPDLELFAAEHDLPMVAIEDLVAYERERAAAPA
jgi:3,4-dihydroxy 2-butanone 4-phosphate synthase/3,4-dihydroxy 2-butanone 4-phosphate synthase/GTP cyclohydrolase II